MSKYKRYEKYKDSGIEWIGEIPEHWEINKLKRLSNIITGNTPSKSEEENYDDEGIPWVKPDNIQDDGTVSETKERLSVIGLQKARLIPKNSAIVCCIGTVGKVGFTQQDCTTNQQINSIIFDRISIWNSKYGFYCLYSSKNEHEKYSNKVVVSILNKTQQGNIIMPVPSLDEQKTIASFLDQKTAVIDDLIADKEKLIELLQEKRQAIITEAVTKGLNPNVKMKDSGIEWIGEIPEHWSITKMKYLLSPKKYSIKAGPFGSQLKNDDMVSGDVKVYNQKTVLDNDFKSGDYYIENYKYEELRAFEVFSGDLLVTTRGTIGKTAIVPKDAEKGILHPCLIKITLNPDKVLNEYINVVFNNTKIVTNQIMLESNDTTIDVIYTDTLKNLVLPIPPLEEQKSIIDFVDAKIGEIDGLISSINNQIQKLKEYRQSLIFEAVTGKIDVRDYVVD